MHSKTYKRYYRSSRHEELKAVLFASFLVIGTVGLLLTSFLTSGPIVLGTEMNTNGLVEYLCLGNGCENMTSMDW